MKKTYQCLLFCLSLIINGFAQTNHITMSLRNCSQPTGNTLEFDLMVTSDGSPNSDLRANAFQFGVNFNTAILQSGDSIRPFYIPGTSDFLPPLSTYSFPPSAYNDHIRIIESAYTGSNTGNTMIIGHPYSAGRFRLTSVLNWVASGNPNFSLQDSVVIGKTSCMAVVWIDSSTTVSSVVDNVNASGSISLNCTNCPPNGGFQASDTIICNGGGCINFTDQSYNSPTSWQWSFPGATPSSSTSQNPTNICYSATGTYPVTLIATNSFGSDTLTFSPLINVSPSPLSASITQIGNDTLICASSGGNYFQWYKNGMPIAGATDTFYVASTAGYFKVAVVNSAGCSLFSNQINITAFCTLSIYIDSLSNASCGSCNDGRVTAYAQNGTAPYTYTWYTSPLQNGNSIYHLTPGTYTVCIVDGSGCTACHSVYIDSVNCPVLSISFSSVNTTCLTCNNGTATAYPGGGTPPYTYSWSTVPVQTTATATGLSGGTYNVCAVDARGCHVCGSTTIGVGNCHSNFNIYPDTAAHHYIAVNTATGYAPIAYIWSWGDGATDTTAFPNHTYPSSGNYTICLHITDGYGCTSDTCESYYLLHRDNSMVFVQVIPQIITAVGTENKTAELKLYPNPANSTLMIYGVKFTSGTFLHIYNAIGEQLYSSQHAASSLTPLLWRGEAEVLVDVHALERGIYFVEIKTETENIVAKFVKQ